MGNKSKEKRKARKRQLSSSKTNEDLEVIEVSLQKKKLLEDSPEIIQAGAGNFTEKEAAKRILPTRETLGNELIAAVRNRHFAIVEGPLGCGKTFLAYYASKVLELPLHVMQMGDQIDSKTLFGSYHCTEVAGQFVWKESAFVKCLQAPGIILLEDIDAANADVISKIIEVASNRQTNSSKSDKNTRFHEEARIIATMSRKSKKEAVLDGVPIKIRVEQLTDRELKELVVRTFPRISHNNQKLISCFRKIEAFPGTGNSRQLTSSDFLRGCARLSLLPDVSDYVATFAELIDVWCLADPKERASQLCTIVASFMNVNPDRVHTHLSVRQPEVKYDEKVVSVGRASLSRKISMIKTGRHRLGHTRDVVQLMERIVVCVSHNEPLLLVGETGVGKTSVVQAVADLIGVTLDVVNVSPTSDSDELIQGYKPTTIGRLIEPFTKFYMDVFSSNFDVSNNKNFIDNVEKCLSSGRFKDYLSLVEATAKKALQQKSTKKDERWASLLVRARQIRIGLEKGAAPFALQKGAVLEAAEKGHWLLVDEINLAPPEFLDAIVHALSAPGTHPNFRLFACMNPATDAGKRRLPPSVRTKFTEFFVSETADPHQLALIVSAYLPTLAQQSIDDIVRFYMSAKQLYPSSYSLRTLCRALLFTADNMFGSLDQSIYEAISMAFLSNLQDDEKSVMKSKIQAAFRCKVTTMPVPKNLERYVKIGGYFVEKGTMLPQNDPKYVITKTVKGNLAEIARIVCSGRFPILLEGETSAGKTSIVCHLAKVTGNKIVRINNHEHTDVQEYMGSYVADSGGRLVFREGALVQAVRDGSWVILDELNLAPTDVIEALNRLLDDNRELFVPEINETIRAHPRFRLFATQNPAGSYAGRKRLSRALMSRFIVLRFHHLPIDDLSEMVCARCGVPPNAAHKMIEVLDGLRNRRSLSGLFSARDGLMTLRDVFRWAKRMTTDETTDDWLQILVNHGYFLLAGRCRNEKDELTVVETLEKVIKRKIDKELLFSLQSPYMPKDIVTDKVVLTLGMRRMLVLTEQAWIRNEAVLMVGETGGGKTTLSEIVGRGKLRCINCHERTETADLLGRLRPKQDGGFEWSDGVVISAMRDGVPLLVDEISLAEDSVLERLNPLFEEDRALLLSDAGTETEVIESTEGFQMIATMNPGGDYGKKELSKALRNRFTEVWTSNDYTTTELITIFDQRLARIDATKGEARITPTRTATTIVSWIAVFFKKYSHVFRHAPSVRDVVACAELYASAVTAGIDTPTAIKDALSAVFLDSLAGLTTRLNINPEEVLVEAFVMLHTELMRTELVGRSSEPREFVNGARQKVHVEQMSDHLKVGHLRVSFGPLQPRTPKAFSLKAPTCTDNFYRIARGLLINKPILLEGAPGCGKSSTVMALAHLTGNPITRLNLSDQTDLSDLFGSDVPVLTDDGTMTFRWEDGPVLKAIKRGEWVLLDEMNLASQSVLEGLNACFDHRRILYIAELNREFEIPANSNCRFFACQNPRVQGGNRRALPKSFINRFTNIYTNDLDKTDIETVLHGIDEKSLLTDEQRTAMVQINEQCGIESDRGSFVGGPHSFNLRDLLRWFELRAAGRSLGEAFELVYMARTRREEDKELMRSIYEKSMRERLVKKAVLISIDETTIRIGKSTLKRKKVMETLFQNKNRLLASQNTLLYRIATCIDLNWLALLVGPRNCGKRSVIENAASLCGKKLKAITLNADTDAQELIGSYEQVVNEDCLVDAKKKVIGILNKKDVTVEILRKIQDAEDLSILEASLELIMVDHEDLRDEISIVIEAANQSSMRFEWTDSVFVDSYLHGDWVLIEDVNLCSAAVLDRLNSCLESGGKLVVAERQNSYKPLEPHPEFRVFLSMDPRVGEISRAMRNRSVEIYIDEDSRWNSSAIDVRAVVDPKLSMEWCSRVAGHLSAEQQLHLSMLLEENGENFSLNQAWKMVGGSNDEPMEIDEEYDDEEYKVAPEISDMCKLSGEYEKYLISMWKQAAKKTRIANVEAVPMTFLSTSPWILVNLLEDLRNFLGTAAVDAVIKRIPSNILDTKGRHFVDSEFSATSPYLGASAEAKFSRAVLFEWMLQMVSKIPVEKGSAENLSSTLTKYEIATCDVTFNNLSLVSNLVRSIVETWKNSSVIAQQPAHEVRISIAYLLLIAASRRKLTTRTGCAAIYLAWNDFRKEVLRSTEIQGSKSLTDITNKINEGWTSESYDTFVNDFIHRWRNYAMCYPFSEMEQSKRFIDHLEKIVAMDLEDNDAEMLGEDEEENSKKKKKVEVSPVELTNNVVESVEALFNFLTTGVVDQENDVFKKTNVYNGIEWKDQKSAQWIRTAAVFCANIASYRLSDNETEKSDIHVSDLIAIGGGAHSIATRLFFSAICYNSSMSNLSIYHLQKFPIRELKSKLWRLAVNSEYIRLSLQKSLDQLGLGIEGWVGRTENGMKCGVEMMENALPPKETLDPVIFEEERLLFVKAKRRIVERQLNYLAEWRKIIGRQTADCDSTSSQVIIKGLNELRREIAELEQEEREHQPDVFRQSATQYNQLCAELRAFLDVAKSAISDAEKSNEEVDEQSMVIRLARIKSFAMSAENFRVSVLRKFVSFVDVSMPFVAGLLIVEIMFNQVALKWNQEAKRQHATGSSAFPRFCQTSISTSGLISNEVTAWAVRDGSPMPLHLKSAVVRRKLANVKNDDGSAVIEIQWTRSQWKKWYEKNIAKAEQKNFVYLTKTEEEKDELEIEELFANREQDLQVLPDSDVSMLLEAVERKKCSLVDEKSRKSSDERYEMAMVWMRYVMSEVGVIPIENTSWSQCIDGDQNLFEVLAEHEGLADEEEVEDTKVIDVYKHSSIRECRRVAKILERLAARTKEILERWPEVVTLKTIVTVIKEFFTVSVSTPHIKVATQIENLIEVCEQWEMMADRENSLRDPLGDLRKLLVEWKKMEVRCWSSLLIKCENETKQRAQLVAFPLFESLFDANTSDMEAAIIAMSIEWMHNATVVDFATRVETVESLSRWARIIGKKQLATQLEAASRHFGIFVEQVEQRLKDVREPAENSLKDYLKVVKYNDLNLWNIRVSSTKAHAHLYKIVRRFKDAINVEMHDDFEILQKVDAWKQKVFKQEDQEEQKDAGEELTKRVRQMKSFAKTIERKVAILCETTAIEELTEQTKAADATIRTMINYVGEDEEKEKQQGYARNSRQRQIAMVIKEAQAIGLNARRAVLLAQEDINRRSIVDVLAKEECEKEIRICASGRNLVIQKANKIDQQVSVSTRKHLSGMIEYGMSYIILLQENIGKWNSQVAQLRVHSEELKVIGENQTNGWIVDQGIVRSRFSKVSGIVEKMGVMVVSIKRRLAAIPANRDENIRSQEHYHPLSRLSQSDEMSDKLNKWAEKLMTLVNNMKRTNERIEETEGTVYRWDSYVSWWTQLHRVAGELKMEMEQFDDFFTVEKTEIGKLLEELPKWAKEYPSSDDVEEVETDVTKLLLLVQKIYKSLEGVTVREEDKALDQINVLVEALKNCDIGSVVQAMGNVVEDHASGEKSRKNIVGLAELARICAKVVEGSVVQLTNCLGNLCVLYHSILSLTIQLYEKGYVNTIPKAERQESGEGQTDDSGEGGGIGEGGTAKDAKDVTEEMEETGQIEGLEDEQPTNSEEHEAKNDNEKPIDMEDDFAEDLQDIDKNEKGDQEDGEDQSDEEPEVEDQIGDVEEEDEKQLDPKMWDEEEKEQDQKNMDQEQQGAEDQTEDMVAKEDDAQTKDQEQEGGEEEDHNDQEMDKDEQENVDERERENDERIEDQLDFDDMNKDEMAENGEMNENEGEEDGDETDKEEEAIEGEGEEEHDEQQDLDEVEESKTGDEEQEDKQKEDETLEQGTGGEKNEHEKKDVADGGLAEEVEKDDQEDKDESGEGKSKSDPNGEAGEGEAPKEREDKNDEEKQTKEDEEKVEKRRELATDDAPMEDAEMGEGDENETGQQMENAEVSDRQIIGKGTIEEARKTKREEKREEEKLKRRELKDSIKCVGGEEGGEVDDEYSEEIKEAQIHMASHDLLHITEEKSKKDLVTGMIDDDEEHEKNRREQAEGRSNDKADEQWAAMSRTVGILASELAENLRLILEPQRANKMQGDYRSGKRLNMRRLIPYIASEYRKDRIWMRRTKRAQREYQILIAVDDSESMNENGIHQNTCESVCIVEDALRRCDAGKVSVCSFGANVNTIIPFGEASATSSIEMLKQMTFSQKKTDLLLLLKTAKRQLNEIQTATSEQMLIVISDGRGALSQGADKVRSLYSALQGVTVLFIILDSGKKSIEDHTVASFKDNKVMLTPYLSMFPFPFYALVKSVQQLPSVIAESIRQWFEMTTQHA